MQTPRLLTLSTIARRFRLSEDTVLSWIDAGFFPAPLPLPGCNDKDMYRWEDSTIASWVSVIRMSSGMAASPPKPDEELTTDMESAVTAVVEAMRPGSVMAAHEIAAKSGYSNTGKLREFLRRIATGGKLRPTGRGYEKIAV